MLSKTNACAKRYDDKVSADTKKECDSKPV